MRSLVRRRRSSPARSGWRGSGACPVTWRETVGSIPIAADPRRRGRPGGRTPFASGRHCPSPGRSTGTRRRWSSSIERVLRRVPAAASSRPSVLEPAPLVAERVLRTASRSHGVSGWPCVLPVLIEIDQLVLRGRARGHVGGPEGRPRSGCRPDGRPRAGMSMGVLLAERVVVLLVVRGALGGAGAVLGARRGGGVLGACPVTLRETGASRSQSLRILGEGVRPGGPHPFASGWHCPRPSTGCRHRRGRWLSRSSLGLPRVPAAASSRPDSARTPSADAEDVLRGASRGVGVGSFSPGALARAHGRIVSSATEVR